MTAKELRQKYLDFFKDKGHAIIPSAPLVPENDPTVLFTTAGMHPLVPYLLGEKHPGGKRLANVQKCVRTGDIDDVGDNRHLTFFEMLGNWSLGDYFKREAIEWSWEFLTDKKWLGLDPQRIYVTVFEGDENTEQDKDSIKIWQEQYAKAGIKAEVSNDKIVNKTKRIVPLPKDDNWWGPAGQTGPCGPCTEMFYDVAPEKGEINGDFNNLVDNFRLIEIWNDVFMEFNKTASGTFEKMVQQNVDTGMGLERTIVVVTGKDNVFDTDLYEPIIRKIEEISGKQYQDEKNKKPIRIIADHLKAAVFMIADGVIPSNVERGYILRRLIRRAIRQGKILGIEKDFTPQIADVVVKEYGEAYPELEKNKEKIFEELDKEEKKFKKTLERGLQELEKLFLIGKAQRIIDGKNMKAFNRVDAEKAFFIYQTYGFPLEMIQEELAQRCLLVDEKEFNEEMIKHQELSRTASAGQFASGLADHSEEVKKLHTATHLLNAALRKVLGDHVEQRGSNITSERLRFDFSHNQKMSKEEIEQAEKLVNEAIGDNLEIRCEETSSEEAKAMGAIGVFGQKYGDKVKVYSVGAFSKEICGGPHVERTGKLGKFGIKKEEASSAGVRRIKAVLE